MSLICIINWTQKKNTHTHGRTQCEKLKVLKSDFFFFRKKKKKKKKKKLESYLKKPVYSRIDFYIYPKIMAIFFFLKKVINKIDKIIHVCMYFPNIRIYI
jgi:hypothetical protein